MGVPYFAWVVGSGANALSASMEKMINKKPIYGKTRKEVFEKRFTTESV